MDLEFAKRAAAHRAEVETEIAENTPPSSDASELTPEERWRNLGSRIIGLATNHYHDRDFTGDKVGTLHRRVVSLEGGTHLILELNAREFDGGFGRPGGLSEVSAIWRSSSWTKDSPLAVEKVNEIEARHGLDYVARELALIEQSVTVAETAIQAMNPVLRNL